MNLLALQMAQHWAPPEVKQNMQLHIFLPFVNYLLSIDDWKWIGNVRIVPYTGNNLYFAEGPSRVAVAPLFPSSSPVLP